MTADTAMARETETTEATETAEPTEASIYGSFLLDGTELVLGIESLQEVVPFPDHITRMPLAPDHLLGFFNLRGEIVPLVNLKRILASENPAPAPSQKVAIVESGGARIGLLFDATGEILRVRPEAKCRFRYASGGAGATAHPVLSGVLSLDEGARVLQVIDAPALLRVENVPQIVAWQGREGNGALARRRGRLRAHWKKCISFRSGGARLGFEMGGIHEIIRVPEIRKSALQNGICLGSIPLRERLIPVVDFSRLLDGVPAAQAEVGAGTQDERRIVVMQREEALFGLLVDAVENIVSYSEEEVIPIPLLAQGRSRMFQGCIPGQTQVQVQAQAQASNAADIILLDHREIFSHAEIVQLTQGHLRLYETGAGAGTGEGAAGKAKTAAGRQVYISFTLGYPLGLPIRHVHEIVHYPADLLRAPGLPPHVRGLINLRGQMVTIADTRALYGMPESEVTDQTRILILKRDDGEKVGFVVDTLDGILTAEAEDKTDVSGLLMQKIEPAFRSDIEEAIQPKGEDGNRRTLLVLNPASLLRRIQGEGAGPGHPLLEKLAA